MDFHEILKVVVSFLLLVRHRPDLSLLLLETRIAAAAAAAAAPPSAPPLPSAPPAESTPSQSRPSCGQDFPHNNVIP